MPKTKLFFVLLRKKTSIESQKECLGLDSVEVKSLHHSKTVSCFNHNREKFRHSVNVQRGCAVSLGWIQGLVLTF